jgi:hypothetical protein
VSAAAEHLTTERMLDYARRSLDPIDLLTTDDHLVACVECRGRMVDEEGLRATVTSLEREIRAALPSGPEHLPYDQVESLAEDRLRGAAREIAETHAEICASCRAEIADLKGFAAAFRESRRAAAAALVAAAARPGGATAAAVARATSAAARLGSNDVDAGDRPLFSADVSSRDVKGRWWMPRPAFVAAFAAVVLVAAGGWILRGRNHALREKVEELTRQNESLAGRAAEAEALRAQQEQKPRAASPEAATAIALKDRGGDVGLDGEGQLTGLDLLPVAEGRAVAAALRHAKVEVATLTASLALPAPAGDAIAPAPVSPAGTVVRGQRPTLSWDEVTGITAYTVVVSDESGAVAARADNVRGHTWTVSRPLRRGTTYTWRVSAGRTPASGRRVAGARTAGAETGADAPADVALAGGAQPAAPDAARATAPASGTARFRVLDKDEAAALDRLLRSTGGSALAAGVFYARAGLLDDAEKELRAVLDANPDSPIAKSIVQSFLEERVRNSTPAGATR